MRQVVDTKLGIVETTKWANIRVKIKIQRVLQSHKIQQSTKRRLRWFWKGQSQTRAHLQYLLACHVGLRVEPHFQYAVLVLESHVMSTWKSQRIWLDDFVYGLLHSRWIGKRTGHGLFFNNPATTTATVLTNWAGCERDRVIVMTASNVTALTALRVRRSGALQRWSRTRSNGLRLWLERRDRWLLLIAQMSQWSKRREGGGFIRLCKSRW